MRGCRRGRIMLPGDSVRHHLWRAARLAPTRLFELLLGVLHRLAEGGPVVLVVEDLHWADQSTRDLVGFLVRNLRGGVALVVTYRSDELTAAIRCGHSWR